VDLPCPPAEEDILADPREASCLARIEEDSLVVGAFLVVVKQVAYQDVGVPCPWNLVAYPWNLVACPWNLVACPLEASCQAVVVLHSVEGASLGRKAV